jgi:hypothetical protein
MAGLAFAAEGDGVGFATESYAASALYATLASLSGALWRIRRARSRSQVTTRLSPFTRKRSPTLPNLNHDAPKIPNRHIPPAAYDANPIATCGRGCATQACFVDLPVALTAPDGVKSARTRIDAG